MDRNLFLAFALSFAVLTGWMLLTTPPPGEVPPVSPGEIERGQSPGATEAEPQASSSGGSPALGLEEPPLAIAGERLPGSDEAASLPSSPTSGGPLTSGSQQTGSPRSPGAGSDAVEVVVERTIEIDKPLYRAVLSNRGAGVTSWTLKKFRQTAALDAPLVELVTGEDLNATTLVTPFRELGLGDLSKRAFDVVSEDASSVVFETSENGVTIRKTFTFVDDSYQFKVLIEVENHSDAEITPIFEIDLPAHIREGSDFREIALGAFEDGSKIDKPLKGLGGGGFFDSIRGKKPSQYVDYFGEIDWAGIQTTYFLSIVLPDAPSRANVRMSTAVPREAGITKVFYDKVEVPPGKSAARELRGYMGPKEMERLEALGSGAEHSIDLGWAWVHPLTRFFSLVLKAMYAVLPNYGVAIILLTILVRLVTAPLTMKQMRSMERMRALSPKLKEIQEKFSDDRAKVSEETMALYKREKVNPLGGCLPMLLQFPVFIGLFYALRSTIQLRQSPFVGWITDLSAPEMLFEVPGLGVPFRVLPLIMGATMVLQQKITPMQADPAQARMMMTVMPIMMTFVFYQFPSGLVLYWMVSNMLAIGHQLLVGKRMRTKEAPA